jgi:Domain of unknown function (DUF4149)
VAIQVSFRAIWKFCSARFREFPVSRFRSGLPLILQRLLLTVWVGSLCASGLLAAPVLFRVLQDRALAGTVAGELFAVTAWLGLACGSVLLALEWAQLRKIRWRFWCLLLMLALTATGQFVLTPMIVELRTAGLVDTVQFGQLHGISSLLYLVTLLTGLLLVAAGPVSRGQSDFSR